MRANMRQSFYFSRNVQEVRRSQFNLYFLPSIEKFEICNYITQHIEADWQIIIPIPTNWGPDFPEEVNKGHEMETRTVSVRPPEPWSIYWLSCWSCQTDLSQLKRNLNKWLSSWADKDIYLYLTNKSLFLYPNHHTGWYWQETVVWLVWLAL